MAIRTTRTQVTFAAPFRLKEIAEQLPPGTYDIDTDEEAHEGNERTVYVRVATVIHVRGPYGSRMVTIDPLGLDAALGSGPTTGTIEDS